MKRWKIGVNQSLIFIHPFPSCSPIFLFLFFLFYNQRTVHFDIIFTIKTNKMHYFSNLFWNRILNDSDKFTVWISFLCLPLFNQFPKKIFLGRKYLHALHYWSILLLYEGKSRSKFPYFIATKKLHIVRCLFIHLKFRHWLLDGSFFVAQAPQF